VLVDEPRARLEPVAFGREVLRSEAEALLALSAGLGAAFAEAVTLLLAATGKVIVCGMGKSGHVGQKIAASLASTGTPAFFVHPAEAAHGDLGMIEADDLLILLSASGESVELLPVIAYAQRLGIPVVAISAKPHSRLGQAADIVLQLPDVAEACPHNLAPSTSTTAAMAMGDALALTVMSARGFRKEDFGRFHPGGKLGLGLTPVRKLMLVDADIPLVEQAADSHATIMEMTVKRLGVTGVVDAKGNLVGIITDGDLRRSFERAAGWLAQDIMTYNPITVVADLTAEEALARMHANSISSLFVVEGDRPIGVLHLHHFLGLGLGQ
jgi:arabinose-5-phosphate isomerase